MCPSEHTLAHNSGTAVPIPVIGHIDPSFFPTPLNHSPPTPRTLHSHPNFQEETHARPRPLLEIDPLPTASDPTPPLAQAHHIHTSS